MPLPKQIDSETLLRRSRPGIAGMFFLTKIEFVKHDAGDKYADRCDNYTFTSVRVSKDTDYEWQDLAIIRSNSNTNLADEKTDGVSYKKLIRYETAIDAAPDFAVIYLEFAKIDKSKTLYNTERSSAPSSMWWGQSIFHLLKTMREWHVTREHLDPMHPMAIYSEMFYNTLSPPGYILDEIDSWPDMHLYKFLKQNDDFKSIPYPYPEPTAAMDSWVLEMSNLYSQQTQSAVMAKYLKNGK